jgi:hypothetical protein
MLLIFIPIKYKHTKFINSISWNETLFLFGNFFKIKYNKNKIINKVS